MMMMAPPFDALPRSRSLKKLGLDLDGRHMPSILKLLPPGRYRLELVADGPSLTAAQDEGIVRALAQLDAGQGRSLFDVVSPIRRRAKS